MKLDLGLGGQSSVLLFSGADRIVNSGKGGLQLSSGHLLDLFSSALGDSLDRSLSLSLSSLLSKDRGVWVESLHHPGVLQWVDLGGSASLDLLLGWSDGGLDLVGVDDLGDIGVADNGGLDVVSSLQSGESSLGSEQVSQSLDGSLGPDAESSEMSTWGEVSDVESVDVDVLNSWEVSDGSFEVLRIVVSDDERSSSVLPSLSSSLSLSWSQFLGVDDSLDVVGDSVSLEDGHGLLSRSDVVDVIGEDQWQLWNVKDSVSSGLDQRSDGGGGDSGGQGVSPLLNVDLSVPSSPGSEREGHSSGSTHVTVGSLS